MKKGDVINSKANPERKAQVNWVVEGEAGITYLEPGEWAKDHNNIRVEDWDVLVSSQETYQSSVEQMSVEELRANIEKLRLMRMGSVKVKAPRAAPAMSAFDPRASLIANLSPEKIAELKKKLGIG
jgi:hypothetical protein